MKGSHDPLLGFWDPSMSQEQLKLETSNSAYRFIIRSRINKMHN